MSTEVPPDPRPARGRLVVDRLSPGLSAELWRMVEEARGGDALAPVTVVAPTPYAGLHLRESLGESGFANVRFIFMPVLAEMLGGSAAGLGGRRPLTRVIEGALLRRVLDGAGRRAAPCGGPPGHAGEPALVVLRSCGPPRTARGRPTSSAAAWARRSRGSTACSARRWRRAGTTPMTSRGRRRRPWRRTAAVRWGNLGPVILYLPRRLSPGPGRPRLGPGPRRTLLRGPGPYGRRRRRRRDRGPGGRASAAPGTAPPGAGAPRRRRPARPRAAPHGAQRPRGGPVGDPPDGRAR